LGNVPPATALNFLLLGSALAMPRGTLAGHIYAGLTALALVITALALVGYAYGVEALYKVLPFSAMALPTAVSFALLLVAALLARPDAGWTAAIVSKESGGIAARSLLPAAVILPVLLTGIVVTAHRRGEFEAPFGFAVLAVAMVVSQCGFIAALAIRLTRSDRERQRSERLVQAIIENSPALIYVKDLEGRYLMVNRRYCEAFQVESAAMVGKTDHDIFPGASADGYRAMDQRVARSDCAMTKEETAPQNGRLHSYISVKSPLRDDAGQVYAVFGISTDITELKRAEAALAASEERASAIVDTALDAVVSMDDAGVITGWNPQADRIFGWSREEALGRPVDQIVMPERFREAHRDGLARYLATGASAVLDRRIEMTALHRDGHEFPIELSITPIRAGETMIFSGFVRDITDRKLAETRLQSQLEWLRLLDQITRATGQRQDTRSIFQVVVRSLEDQLPADFVCICRHDQLKRTLAVAHVGVKSNGLGHALGIAEGAEIEIDGNGLSRCVRGRLVYEPDTADVDFPFPRRLAKQGLRSLVAIPLIIERDSFGVMIVSRLKENAFSSTDCEFLKQLGEHVALAAHQAQLRDRLQRAYDDLRQSQESAMQQERLKALGQMASGIAHDINNAISPVAVYTKSLLEREPGLSEPLRDYLGIVGRVVSDVSATVGRMRDFYRRNDLETALEPVNINELIPHVVELTRARWSDMPQQRGIVIKVVTDLESGLPCIMGNAAELREAMTNLVFNAVDAMPEGGVITISTRLDHAGPHDSAQGRVQLTVADTGGGMDEETRLRCLEPFFTTKGERGTGLGLAMVYGAAQRHKADLAIDSALGKGSRVRLEFAATATSNGPDRSVIDRSNIRPLRLLVVDDDPAVLQSTQVVLQLDGHTVVAMDGGQAGIQALRAARDAGEPFDMMITDLGMPYVDGNQVARAAKELLPSMIVVLLTGWGRRMSSRDEAPVHVDHVLPKPLDLDELREIFLHHAHNQAI
jgi:PAS domain S-box-containing protein